jgi:hypothetical protein
MDQEAKEVIVIMIIEDEKKYRRNGWIKIVKKRVKVYSLSY